jgi:hypothetical protein
MIALGVDRLQRASGHQSSGGPESFLDDAG